jgi:RNA polymerase sigma factor (sigma-70 family)
LSRLRPRIRPQSDEQLVLRFRAGDEAAFAEIVERFRPRLLAYATRMLRGRTSEPADDVVQDVFIRAYRRLGADDRPMNVRPWLYRIAHNRCIDVMRVDQPVELIVEPPSLSTTEERAEGSERMRHLVEDIQGLPASQRSALIIRELDGLSYDEIAAALDVTVPAVKSLLVRARMNLAAAAEAREPAATPHPAALRPAVG